MTSRFGTFAMPADAPAWAALVAAVIVAALAALRPAWWSGFASRLGARRALAVVALAAVALSAGYVAHYLRGGPRIIDATSYFLEARALAHGLLSFDLPLPTGSFRGRFLVTTPAGDAAAVIFPPGWPAVLALGFLAHAPLAVGPLIGGALVIATYALAQRAFGRDDVALVAALLSAVCAALRYHTADTMAHGLAALLAALAVAAALGTSKRSALLAGLALGWLVATRPVTGVALTVVVGALIGARADRRVRFAVFAASVVPGVALLLAHQRAATGGVFDSVQLRYYALADGPAGCFRWGFGSSVGCLHEHGDFVRAHMPSGYGPWEALGTMLRRLRHHILDIGNAEPLALLVPWTLWRARRNARAWALGASAGACFLAVTPFYFDGSYPGGGARLFAEMLPFEHALVAFALTDLGLAAAGIALSLAGFAVHSSHDHYALSAREGGRPMFEQAVLDSASVTRGLVFVGTDHGWNLGFDPAPNARVLVARRYDDARDHILWEARGRPPTFRYDYDPWTPGSVATLVPYEPMPTDRFEVEAEWPALALRAGWIHPRHVAAACPTNGRGLALFADADVDVEIVARRGGRQRVTSTWVAIDERPTSALFAIGDAQVAGTLRGRAGSCEVLSGAFVFPAGRTVVRLRASGAPAVVDSLVIGDLE